MPDHLSPSKRPPVIPAGLLTGVLAPLTILVALLGVWTSYQISFGTWRPDSDVADMPMLWWGVRQHGLRFLQTWYYTQDNWLLTLTPLMFAVFSLVGANAFVVILSGWVIFLICIALTLAIAHQILPKAYLPALSAVLMMSNAATLGRSGFFSYPVDHNSSLLWCLAALLTSLRWLATGRASMLACCFAALVTVAISDPWAKAALVAPLFIASCMWCVLDRPRRWRFMTIAALSAVAGVAAQTRLFGLLAVLPGDQLPLANWAEFKANVVALGRSARTLFDPFPVPIGSWPATDALVCAVVGCLLFAALSEVLRHRQRLHTGAGFAAMVMLLSSFGVVSAFLIGVWPDKHVAPRFLINAYVFIPLLVCLGVSVSSRSAGLGSLAALYAFAMVGASAWSSRDLWLHRPRGVASLATAEWIDYLKTRGLVYGYGSYWGTEANGVSWISGGTVLIRPVVFDPKTGHVTLRTGQASTLWDDPSDHPGADRTTFILIGPDPENCSDLQSCVRGVEEQFGPSQRILRRGDWRILVWPHDLILPHAPSPGA